MADDIENHEMTLSVSPTDSLNEVLDQVLKLRYLPIISGGRATWIVQSGKPLAVLAQQWSSAKCLIPKTSPISEAAGAEKSLYFNYWIQSDPDVVLECLKDGKMLPDPYGRPEGSP
jgi:hypothetical protein